MSEENIIHSDDIIPVSQRREPLTMGLLWITMMTFFPGVLVGFTWFKEGLSFMQVLICTLAASLLMLAYAIPSCYLGAKSGRSYGCLIRNVFGRMGNRIVALNLVWMFIAWYGLCSLFLAENLEGLFHYNLPILYVAPALAFLMAFNNFWGFKGVANFARYFAAPLLIIWVGYTFYKTIGTVPSSVFFESGTCTLPAALALVANFVIGVAVWGNEADYWRYGKPKMVSTLVPVGLALLLGQVIFPISGWLVARMTGITDYGAGTSFMNDYSFGGIAILGALVLCASYFAANDSNLYGSTNALNHIVKLPHRVAVTILAVLGATVAAILSGTGCAQSLEKVASLNCVIMAMPTVILTTEYFIVRPLLSIGTDFSRIPRDHELPLVYRPAVAALVAGCAVGVATAGVIPGLESLHVGVCSVQGWLTGMLVYIPCRYWQERQESQEKLDHRSLSQVAVQDELAEPVAR